MFPSFADDAQIEAPVKKSKRRWTEAEREIFFKDLGQKITNKLMPTGRELAAVAGKMKSRTVAQIRSMAHNYISGKMKDCQNWIRVCGKVWKFG